MATTPNFGMLIPDMDTVIDVEIPGLAASLGIIDTEMKHLEDNKLEASAAYVHPNHTGDVTSSGDGAQTITNKAVTLAKMADMATASIIGRTTAAAGVPEVISKANAKILLDVDDLETDNTANKLNIAQNTKEVSDLAKSVTAIAGGGSGSVTGSVTAPVSSLANTAAGAFSQLQLSGRTYTNYVTNGNFVGTTGWTAATFSLSATNNILTGVCINNTSRYPQVDTQTILPSVLGDKWYGKCKVRVTNSVCDSITIKLTTPANQTIASIATPVQDAWYNLSGIATISGTVSGDTKFSIQTIYVDGDTANGTTVQVQEAFAINLTKIFGSGSEPSLAVCNAMFPYWFGDTKSTAPSEIVATGKNLFDYKTALVSNSINASTGAIFAEVNFYASDYINILPSSTYRLRYGTTSTSGIAYYDINKTYISGVSLTDANTTLTTPANARYLRMTVYYTNLLIQMLEYGATQTTFEPYQSIKAHTPILRCSYPSTSGSSDTFDCVTGVLTRNTNTFVLDDACFRDIYEGVNVDWVRIKKLSFSDYIRYAKTTQIYASAYLTGTKGSILANDDLSSVGYLTNASIGELGIYTTKGYYADLAAAKADLIGRTLYYQLATPTYTYYPAKVIPCPANATISQDNVISDYGFYSSGLTISDSTYPIVTLAEVVKIDQSTGEETQIAISTCTVAGDGLSFTSTALADGDLVWYRFYRSPYYTIGQIDYTRKYGVWEAWTPTLTWTTGTPASVTTVARSVKNGSTCTFNFMVTSADGNNASQLSISLPATPKDNNSLISFSAQQLVNTTWTNPLAYLDDDSGGITFRSFATATDGQTVTIIVSGQYEI